MDPSSSSAAALKLEIARLTGAIQRRKTEDTRVRPYPHPSTRPRSNVYVNPSYKPVTKQVSLPPSTFKPRHSAPLSTTTHDVVIGGVAFESSGRSLVRKDLPKSEPPTPMPSRPPSSFARPIPHRVYNPKPIRGRPSNRNMTLNNNRRPYQSRRVTKKAKYVDKPCPRFTTTGACNRGLTCMYQHDPSKIAICWSFLQGNCPNTAQACNLSHDPTPERTPLCVHFANNGRCTRQNCPFPHVRVGQRDGVCRDFAVLGYCAKGLDCEQAHVRECPDFAEKGVCTTKGCKLPHVIRANRNRKPTSGSTATPSAAGRHSLNTGANSDPSVGDSQVVAGDGGSSSGPHHQVSADDAQLGDEFISLTFHESESEESEDEEDEDEEGDDNGFDMQDE